MARRSAARKGVTPRYTIAELHNLSAALVDKRLEASVRQLAGAWNKQPEFDWEFRKVKMRHWIPWAGSHWSPGQSRGSFVSVPLVYVVVLTVVIAVRSW